MPFKPVLLATVLAAPLVFAAPAAFAVEKPVEFVQKASVAGMFEVQTSQLALKRSRNPEIRAFAGRMIKDHTKAADELKIVARRDHIRPATALDHAHRSMFKDLSKKGDDFDKKYVHLQVDAHNEAVDLFKDYADNGTDARLKDFAGKTLPT
ncbi:MAG: DUF4142 domain-containing protein, partial [Asticcacaulis sp.]